MPAYPPSGQGHQGYQDPFSDRHSPRPPHGNPLNASDPRLVYGQAPSAQTPSQQQQRPTGYALHDNPSYATSMQTLPTGSSYSLAGGKEFYDDGVYPDEDTESKTPLRSEFGVGHGVQGGYDPDQPLCVQATRLEDPRIRCEAAAGYSCAVLLERYGSYCTL